MNHNILVDFCQMLKKLKARWKVNSINLVLIITTFAMGGSLCGYLGRTILALSNLENYKLVWFVFYIIIVTLLWPLSVLAISIPLGQFAFFKRYILKVWQKLSGKKKIDLAVARIAIFASGAGSNAAQIINHFGNSENINISLIISNNPNAGVIEIAKKAGVPYLLIEKERFFNGNGYLPELQQHHINFIVLAGFLWKLPTSLIKTHYKKIINIHPALLPKFGGKGMYGNRVHEAVIGANETETGITIHYVDELYDHGDIIFQAKCQVVENETVDTLAEKIHALEHAYYPKLIAEIIQK